MYAKMLREMGPTSLKAQQRDRWSGSSSNVQLDPIRESEATGRTKKDAIGRAYGLGSQAGSAVGSPELNRPI